MGLFRQSLYFIIYTFIINNINIFLGHLMNILNKNSTIIA